MPKRIDIREEIEQLAEKVRRSKSTCDATEERVKHLRESVNNAQHLQDRSQAYQADHRQGPAAK